MTPGLKPLRCRRSTMASTSGVFPVPPTVMLPTTITGTGARQVGSSFNRYSERLTALAPRNSSANGDMSSARPPSFCHSDRIHSLTGEAPALALAALGGERDVVVAREPRAFHDVHHVLVLGGGV